MASTNIGTAWIQIKPSTKGIASSLKKEFSVSGEVAGESFNMSLAAKMGAVSGVISSVFSKLTNTISSNISSAVSRVDTLAQFPKVLSNFGVASDASAEAIQRVSERIRGLPTALDSAAAGVQNLFMVTKDLSAAENLFYSINDAAMVFASGSAEAVDNFIYGFKQAMSAGKVSAQDFNQMNSAIPGLMDKVAESMGMTFGGLKEGLSKGTVSIESFNSALIKLDQEGGAGMSSMAESAKTATGGIETAIANMNTAITRGITAAIDAIGSENINRIASNIGTALENVGKAIGGVITFVKENKDWFEPIAAAAAAILVVVEATKVWKAAQAAFNLVMNANPIFLLVTVISGVVAALVWFFTQTETGKKIIEAVGKAFGKFFNALGKFFEGVGEWIGEVWQNITSFFTAVGEVIASAAQWVWDTLLSPVISFVTNFCTTVWDIVSGIIIAITAILATIAQWVWDNVLWPIINFYISVYTTIWNGIVAGWNAICALFSTIAQWVWDNVLSPIINFFVEMWNGITDIVTGVWNTITGVFGTIAGWVYDNVIKPIGDFFNGLWEGIKSGVNGVVEGIKTVFGTVAGVVKAPINGIISAINGVIDGINSLTVPDWVPVIGGAHANIPHIPELATGGYVYGVGTDTSDSNLYALSKGEYVIRAAAAREIGYQNLDRMNNTGEFSGGTVINNQFHITGANPKEIANEVSRIIALQQRRVY